MNLCDRFHCLPSQLYQEDAEIIRMVLIHQMGHPEKKEVDSDGTGEPADYGA